MASRFFNPYLDEAEGYGTGLPPLAPPAPPPPPGMVEEQPWEPSFADLQQMFLDANQPPPPPGFLDRLAMGLQGMQGPSWGTGAAIAGFGQGFAQARLGAMGQRNAALARQNQANLEATRASIQSKMQGAIDLRRRQAQRSETIATETRAESRKTKEREAATAESADPMLTPEQAARFQLPLSVVGQRVSQLPPEMRVKVAPRQESMAGARFGVTTAATIRDDIKGDPDIKDFVVVRDNYERVKAGAQSKTGLGDLAIIFAYMKVLDPTSVVRETEYKNAAEAIGKIPLLQTTPKRWIQGDKLTEEGRQSFLGEIERLYDAKLASHQDAVAFYTNLARSSGIDPKLVLRDFTAPSRRTLGGASTVRMVAPDGRALDVPQDKVSEAEARGARRQ